MNRPIGKTVVVVCGLLLRFAVFSSLTWNAVDYISTKIDFATPISAYPRIMEGIFRLKNEIEPYSDDYLHVSPILMSILRLTAPDTKFQFLALLFVDTITAWTLMGLFEDLYLLAGMSFFFNPFTIVSPASLSIGGLSALSMTALLHAAIRKRSTGACAVLIALCAIVNPISPLFLVFPVSVVLGNSLGALTWRTLVCYTGFHLLSFTLTGFSFSYFYSTVVSPLMVSNDTLPNFGLTWNIFSSLFKQQTRIFQIFFATFHLLIIVPTYMRFSSTPYSIETKERYLVLIVCFILLFQSYPTAIDFCLVISLILTADEQRYHNMITRFFPLVMFAVMVLSSVMGVVYVERAQGTPSFLFNINAISVMAGSISIANGLKLARLDGYVPKEKVKKL